jgi:RNA polymerase sigma-70 factor (ECF subfamily)
MRGAEEAERTRAFVTKYQELVVNTCFHFLHDIDDAHDVAQEVFLTALRLAPSISADNEWRAWLYRSASHRSLTALRARKRRSWLRSIWDSPVNRNEHVNRRPDGGPAVNPNDVAAPERTRPDRVLENAELEKALDGAIAALPQRQRIAFTLQRYEQLASSEIASIMRIRTNAVDALLHRARTTLRTRLLRQYQEFLDQ